MIFNRQTRGEKSAAKAKWHKWFAWHPIKIGNKTIWLEYVERRKWLSPNGFDYDFCIPCNEWREEYREIKLNQEKQRG